MENKIENINIIDFSYIVNNMGFYKKEPLLSIGFNNDMIKVLVSHLKKRKNSELENSLKEIQTFMPKFDQIYSRMKTGSKTAIEGWNDFCLDLLIAHLYFQNSI